MSVLEIRTIHVDRYNIVMTIVPRILSNTHHNLYAILKSPSKMKKISAFTASLLHKTITLERGEFFE